MPHFQYAHFETFARKRHGKKQMHQFNILTALYELLRIEKYCLHVPCPMPPNILLGSIQQARNAVNRWYAQARDSQGRRLHKTANAMVGEIFSFPRELFEQDPAAYETWRGRLMQWLLKKYGKRLRLLVEHWDESHPHLHAMLVPMPGESIAAVHPGAAVWAEMGMERQHRGAGRQALEKQAIINWQDEYFAEVAEPCGLLRSQTPDKKGKHLSRREYKARQQALQPQQVSQPLLPMAPDSVEDVAAAEPLPMPSLTHGTENPGLPAVFPGWHIAQPDHPAVTTSKPEDSVDFVLRLWQLAENQRRQSAPAPDMKSDLSGP